ncbi:hypothetical protein E2C01_002825 [Portunus trituberculatus]|uniref:Uncharacterized protein n=1 Tax=Portunus trituberculatus TaxID=210409 RepID=A0A5B7CNI8_PORTR|nr:hypothetical protein [Portunus trituberculatus]
MNLIGASGPHLHVWLVVRCRRIEREGTHSFKLSLVWRKYRCERLGPVNINPFRIRLPSIKLPFHCLEQRRGRTSLGTRVSLSDSLIQRREIPDKSKKSIVFGSRTAIFLATDKGHLSAGVTVISADLSGIMSLEGRLSGRPVRCVSRRLALQVRSEKATLIVIAVRKRDLGVFF